MRALSREDSRAGGLQVQRELSEEGTREEVKRWKWEPGSLNSNSGSANGLRNLSLSVLV